jgi:hypothetical protein
LYWFHFNLLFSQLYNTISVPCCRQFLSFFQSYLAFFTKCLCNAEIDIDIPSNVSHSFFLISSSIDFG